jgi:hypothetical protein
MREERHTAYVANKINEGKATNHLPESSAVLTPSIPPIPIPTAPPSETPHQLEYASKVTALQHSHNVSGEERKRVNRDLPEASTVPALPIPILTPPIPFARPATRHTFDESKPSMKSTAEPCIYDIVRQDEKTSAKEHLPEGLTVETPPVHLPAHQAQNPPALPKRATSLCKHPDEAPPPPTTAPGRRRSLFISPQPTGAPSTQGEGVYLARAAAYIQGRLSKRSLAHDVNSLTCSEDIHQQPCQDAVHMKMTSALWHSPEVSAADPIPTLER